MDDVLKNIERERFSSLNDPGIHGIVTRLSRLDFLDVFPYTCSGHPALSPRSVASSLAEDGIVTISYDLRNPKANNFREKVRKTVAWHNDLVADLGAETFSLYEEFGEFEAIHPDLAYALMEKTATFRDKATKLAITHYVLVRGKEYATPITIATALCGFWQKFSDLIGIFEQRPINEGLEPYYFGFRSRYGKIEASHPYFERYWSLIAKIQNQLR